MTTSPFSISHTLTAPRALVYAVHTESRHLAQWSGPAGFEPIHSNLDLRVGGRNHYGLAGPGGAQMWGLQVYREIEPGRRLVCLQSFSDAAGGLTRHPMAASWPLEMLSSTSFDDAASDETLLTICWQPFNADAISIATFDAARAGMAQGFAGSFEKLAASLAKLQA